MQLAAIDIGSNSIHMIVAQAIDADSFRIVDREKEMALLGRSVFEHGRLTPSTLACGVATLERLAKRAERQRVDQVRAVATAAVREASNAAVFVEQVQRRTGIAIELISGSEEARYIFRAARHAIDFGARRALVIDIGGGSVELAAGDAERLQLARSLTLGVQRLRARFGSARLTKRERRAVEDHVRSLARDALSAARSASVDFAIGTSGTTLALGAAAQRLSGGLAPSTATGRRIPLAALRRLGERLLAADPEQRAVRFGIDAKRADSAHLGAVVLCTLLELAELDSIVLCDASLREGLVLDWLERAAAARGSVVDLRARSVRELARRLGQSGPHSEHVARLALELFDQTRPQHGLGEPERKLLEYAALLHDVGESIGFERHDQHAAYIIQQGDLRGFSPDERLLLSLIARHHHKRPRRHDPELGSLPASRWRVLCVCSALLCLADALDQGRRQAIERLRVTRQKHALVIAAASRAEAELELWHARRKAKRLARVLGQELSVELDPADAVELGLRHTA